MSPSPTELSLPSSFTILYEDEVILAVMKPAGIRTVEEGEIDSLTRRLRAAFDCENLAPVHRLDCDTTGVQIFAKTPSTLRDLEQAFRHRKVQKVYLAICVGIPRNPTGWIRRPLSRWQGGHHPVRTVKGKDGLAAETEYRTLAVARSHEGEKRGKEEGCPFDTSLLLFHPIQGRTHQVRVHAAAFGRPILGDDRYGNRPANRWIKERIGLARQALHAWKITFPHPISAHEIEIHAPIPEDLRKAISFLFPALDLASFDTLLADASSP